MNWKNIKLSSDNKSYIYKGLPVFGKTFIDALNFHSIGLAAVKDESGCFHIDLNGKAIYNERYTRTFGYYCNRATVMQNNNWFHINEKGIRAYSSNFLWCGNFQENLCTVRDKENLFFHIDLNGQKIYSNTFIYAGDYKDGIACVKTKNGLFKHINVLGKFIYEHEFSDLGIFHKNFATAKDNNGWFHINKFGEELYSQRYLMIEPFYNGFALVDTFENTKKIINEEGKTILDL